MILKRILLLPLSLLICSICYGATEDFSTYTEVDGGNDITVTSTRVTYTTLPRNELSYVYKDYGVDYFTDFVHNFTVNVSSAVQYSLCDYWAVANTVGDIKDRSDAGDGIAVYTYYSNQNNIIRIEDKESNNQDSQALSHPITRYITTQRTKRSFSAYVYTDEGRTQLEDTLTVVSSDDKYRYLYAVSTFDEDANTQALTGYTENLDIDPIGSRIIRVQ